MKHLTTTSLWLSLALSVGACHGLAPSEPELAESPDYLIGQSPLSRDRDVDVGVDISDPRIGEPKLEGTLR